MNELISQVNIIAVVIVAVAVFFVARLTAGKKEGNGFLSNVFQSNREFDTTVGLVGMFFILFTMMICFQDNLKEEVPMIFLMAFYALRDIVTGKPKENGNVNKGQNA